jgi:hypothetical protein
MMRRILILSACIFALVLPAAAQSKGGFSGNWSWEGKADKSGSQRVAGFTIKHKGTSLSGTYFVYSTGGPDDDTTDAPSVPFIGTVKGNVATIEYDPEDLHTIDEKNIRYHRPKGKAPAKATLTLKNGKLELAQTNGSLADASMNIPSKLTLHRSK